MRLDFFAGLTFNDHLAIRIHPAIGVKRLERAKYKLNVIFTPICKNNTFFTDKALLHISKLSVKAIQPGTFGIMLKETKTHKRYCRKHALLPTAMEKKNLN
jgi:hypothetical protein